MLNTPRIHLGSGYAGLGMKLHSTVTDPMAFPYRPPSPDLVRDFNAVFHMSYPIPERPLLRAVDLLISLSALIICGPVLLLIASGIWIDGRLHPQNAGPVMAPYIAASHGRKFLKLKFRTVRVHGGLSRLRTLDYRFHPSEHEDGNLTPVGRLLKKLYLDELTQIINIIRGEMSLVGPIPLAWHHFIETRRQGHPVRMLLKAGLLGPAHVRKGEPTFPDLRFDYAYVEMYLRNSTMRLLLEEILIAARGLRTAFEGRGL